MRLFIDALWSPAGKGLPSWLSFVMSYCEVVTFPNGILGQVCCLIVSTLDLCPLSYFRFVLAFFVLCLFFIVPRISFLVIRTYFFAKCIDVQNTNTCKENLSGGRTTKGTYSRLVSAFFIR